MPDMIERVAKAIRASMLANAGIEALPDVILTPNEAKIYLPLARAAITAMREPTEAMTNVMADEVDRLTAKWIWEAAIDAALIPLDP